MQWLAAGVIYSLAYLGAGWMLRDHAQALLWLRITALLVPPIAGVAVIVMRRHRWTGCHWLFWATIALGLTMSALGLVGWTVDELLVGRQTSWLGWHAVFALFGGAAPLFALLTQPHRGSRDEAMASTAVDIAGIAVMAGFLYSRFVVGADFQPVTAAQPSLALLVLSEFQQLLVFVGMAVAAFIARGRAWGPTYKRLAIGLVVQFAILTISNAEIWRGLYRSGFVYDVIWIMPFAFYAWAAAAAPGSKETDAEPEGVASDASRPWVVFGALGLIPLLDFSLQTLVPLGPMERFRNLFTLITMFPVLPLLMARLAVEQSEARKAHRKRRLLAAATEHADDLISIIDAAGGVEHANSAFCRAMGFTVDEIVGAPPEKFLADQSGSQTATIQDAVRSGGVWRGTLVRRRKDQSTFLSSATMVSLSDDSGRLTHFVAVERDVTEEARLREQLIHSERLTAVGQLVSGVAHEINNPLQSILGFAELLLHAERREEQRKDLDRIASEATRAAKIVRNLLTFVRRSGSDRTLHDVNEIARSAIGLREYELGLASVEIEEMYLTDLPAVLVNREEIQQVVLNLVLNAEHAMRTANGRGRLRIRTSQTPAGVAMDIQDDGPGIPPVLAGKIFEPFFSTKEVGQGTGLGLSIAVGIATAHGGTLGLVPSARGAHFRLVLPAASAAVGLEASAAVPIDAWAPMTGRHALVVDDEPILRQLLQRALTTRGFAVDTADTGQAAFDLLEQKRYDVIFCDVRMPKMSGLTLYDTIRRGRPELLSGFVFISGDILNPQLQSVVDSGKVPLISKPFGEAQLEAVLARVLTPSVPTIEQPRAVLPLQADRGRGRVGNRTVA